MYKWFAIYVDSLAPCCLAEGIRVCGLLESHKGIKIEMNVVLHKVVIAYSIPRIAWHFCLFWGENCSLLRHMINKKDMVSKVHLFSASYAGGYTVYNFCNENLQGRIQIRYQRAFL